MMTAYVTTTAAALALTRLTAHAPRPRVYKRTMPRSIVIDRITARNDDDIIMRPSSIVRPPTYHAATAQAEADVAEVHGTPEERPGNYDFVLPGSYVPEASPRINFAATWDGALRVRAS